MKPSALAFLVVLGLGGAAAAQDAEPHLSLELNAATQAEAGCTLSFLVRNDLDADIEKAVFETVLFDANGQVDRMTLLDFGTLPTGRPRVRQFTLSGATCEGLGRILINGADTCEAADLDPSACTRNLQLESRTEIEVIG